MTSKSAPPGFERMIRIKSEMGRLVEVRQFVEDVTQGFPLDVEKVFDLKVAVSEAYANVVKHAGRQTPVVEIEATRSPGRLTFAVTDNGEFHIPTTGPGEGGSRGLGMPLMVALVDEVTFTRNPGGGTTVSLSVLLDAEV